MRKVILAVFAVAFAFAALPFLATSAADEEAEDPKRYIGVPENIPDEASRMPNPRPATKKSVDYGGLLFSSQCVMCHGKSGAGDGDLVERFEMKMPDLTDAEFQGRWTDGELFYVLTNGHGRMQGQKDRFSDETKWDIINYIRTLPK